MEILDTRRNLNAMVLNHEQQIKDLAKHLLELQQYMEFKRREWVGLADDEKAYSNTDYAGKCAASQASSSSMAGFSRVLDSAHCWVQRPSWRSK